VIVFARSPFKLRTMLVRLAKWFAIASLVMTLGGHWAFLQVVAWTGMAVSYSQTDCLGTALIKTFDGKHPCKLCKLVNSAKKSERKSDAQMDLKKMDFFATTVVEFYFPPLKQNPSRAIEALISRVETPPTPPPIFV
jgi:hypothetical protein